MIAVAAAAAGSDSAELVTVSSPDSTWTCRRQGPQLLLHSVSVRVEADVAKKYLSLNIVG